ncbi:hypothetical protein H8356DRAFT_1344370 [Neocallimastix lanati (nom. inval.)]|nr:hypothetical protein H8356DRAFT_1344370 [Neocallimastix sp. JGI-2020a]
MSYEAKDLRQHRNSMAMNPIRSYLTIESYDGHNIIEKHAERLYVRDLIQNNLKYNIPNIQKKYNRMIITRLKWMMFIHLQTILTDCKQKLDNKKKLTERIIIEKKGFRHINDILDTSNISDTRYCPNCGPERVAQVILTSRYKGKLGEHSEKKGKIMPICKCVTNFNIPIAPEGGLKPIAVLTGNKMRKLLDYKYI